MSLLNTPFMISYKDPDTNMFIFCGNDSRLERIEIPSKALQFKNQKAEPTLTLKFRKRTIIEQNVQKSESLSSEFETSPVSEGRYPEQDFGLPELPEFETLTTSEASDKTDTVTKFKEMKSNKTIRQVMEVIF
mmetsp:Transcript_591/g.534  ORF Transcript_591/g.534 Transcript_591/m.534 type:complete len:133 (-) Transcript_591:341-739(-)|eukprot:CAMPEP_0114584932 /NCGR_PEP_ID=MMETSP0125-20121206/8569_1 /TAXON_ID=485358 ORGANISM="Aristerostoma sp., Strain ATCC 50986" /NCGR_SAMPLE_ID=MMETSP0125 /ASSEMBLY_ACC=CAM_ASM_000245 /LENGTH=132 /DNA_ID=CAMNT_0001779691 /DNA_START=146 /DNA_END=544 /DNA_ORIENTATION=+